MKRTGIKELHKGTTAGREAAEAKLAEMRERHEAEASDLIERIETLKGIEASFESLNGKAPASAPPADRRGQSRPTPARTSTPKPAAPARKSGDAAAAKARQDRQDRQGGRSSDLMEKILAFIRANPGRSGREIEEGTGIGQGSVSRTTIKLNRLGKIRTEGKGKGSRKAYYATEAAALPVDDNGAKSEQERKIVECLREADGPLPPTEISIRTGIRSDHVPAMCQAMTNRRVIGRVPPKGMGKPPRYQPIAHPSVDVTPL